MEEIGRTKIGILGSAAGNNGASGFWKVSLRVSILTEKS
jgi:hypothetical protein